MQKVPPWLESTWEQNLLAFEETCNFFKFFERFIFTTKKLPLLKHILALPTCGEIFTNSEILNNKF